MPHRLLTPVPKCCHPLRNRQAVLDNGHVWIVCLKCGGVARPEGKQHGVLIEYEGHVIGRR